MKIEDVKEILLNDEEFMEAIETYTNKEMGKKFATFNYEKKEVAKEIVKLLENVKAGDWEKIKQIIDSRYSLIKNQSNFSADKVTLNRIESWF